MPSPYRLWPLVLVLALLLWAPLCRAGALEDMEQDLAVDDIASGLGAHGRGDHDGAIQRYTHAIDSNKLDKENLAIAYNNRGNAWDDKGDTAKAMEDYNRALRANPLFTEAYFNRAYAFQRLGQFQEALQDYERLLQLEPNLASAYYNRSFAWAALGHRDKAVADVERALQLSPGNSKYRDQLLEWKGSPQTQPGQAR